MKLGVFTDSHYSSAEVTCKKRFNNQSLRKIREAYDFFEKEQCDLVVCLGDLIDTEPSVEEEIRNLEQIGKIFQESKIKTVCLMGNHDAFVLEREKFYQIIGLSPIEELSLEGRHFFFLDACHFKNGKPYLPGDEDSDDGFVPNEEGLKEKLFAITGDAYIFIHQNIDPAVVSDYRITNAQNLFGLIHESKVVKAVFQGHYHRGCDSEYDGVRYITVPAMCEHESAYYVYEI